MPGILETKNLSRVVSGKRLVDDVSIQVERGDVLAVIGRGSGKSSFLMALTCLMVTHDLAQAARLTGRALLLQGGKLVRIGPTKEVLHAETNDY